MPDAFFVSSKTRKRKRPSSSKDPSASSIGKKKQIKGPPTKQKRQRDEELDSDATQEDELGGIDDLELRASDVDPNESGEEDEDETPAQKRLRLAKLHLENVKQSLVDDGEVDAAEIDREIISSRLRQEVAEHSGKLHKFIADSYDYALSPIYLRTQGHQLPITCARGSSDGKYLYTSSKDCKIIKWDLSTGKQLHTFHKIRLKEDVKKGKAKAKSSKNYVHGDVQGHTDEIWSIAVSDDGKWLASGGKDRRVVVWDVQNEEKEEGGVWVKSFRGHRDSISALSFQKASSHLFSASYDRSVNHFDLSVLGYVESLFGHQEPILDLSLLRHETAVSAGGRDTTVRYWKVADEKQLVFRGGGRSRVREVLEGGLEGLDVDEGGEGEGSKAGKKDAIEKGQKFIEGSIECVAMIDESSFISGGDSGSIRLWSLSKKKSQFTVPVAHGLHEVRSATEGVIKTPRWITSVACVPYGDLLASGSWEGIIRLWKVDPKNRNISLVGTLDAPGFVNSLQFVELKKGTVDGYKWSKLDRSKKISHGGINGVVDVAEHGPTEAEAVEQDRPEQQINGHALPSEEPAKTSSSTKNPLLLIAGLGREPRLGRWMTLKGNGEQNCTKVFLLRTRS